jgi:hypothetical protein
MPGPVRTVVAARVAQAGRLGICPVVWWSAWRWQRVSGEHPGPILAGEAKHQQPAQVDCGEPHRPPQVIALDPAVGHPPATISDQPGDRRFHHRPPAPVALLEAAGGRAAAGGAQLIFVRVHQDRAPIPWRWCSAPRTWQRWQWRAKLACPDAVVVAPAGHLTVPALRSMWKSWMVNPPRHRTGQRQRLDRLQVAGGAKCGAGLARPVAGIRQDLKTWVLAGHNSAPVGHRRRWRRSARTW